MASKVIDWQPGIISRTLATAPERITRSLVVALKISTRDLQEEALAVKRYETRTGLLDKSIQTNVSEQKLAGSVFLNSRVASYAAAVHNGWTRERPIEPNPPRRAIAFAVGGNMIFRRRISTPASFEGDSFLFRALNNKQEEITKRLSRVAMKSILKIGGK